MKQFVLALIIILISYLISPGSPVWATDYYVSPIGSDPNPGTLTQPWKTIQKGVDTAHTGDTLYVRAGTYHEAIRLRSPGTANAPIVISGFPGERPVIDGEYTLPTGTEGADPNPPYLEFNYNALVSIEESYLIFTGFEVVHSRGRGIRIWPKDHDTVNNNWVHDCRNACIWALEGDHHLINDNKIWHSADFAPYPRSPTVAVWPGALGIQYSDYTVAQNNVVYHNWGEGLQALSSAYVTLTNNISYDNMAVQVYGDHAPYLTIQRNLVYHTGDINFVREWGFSSSCITVADEPGQGGALGSNYIIVNNLIKGCSQNISFWNSGLTGTGLRDSLIAYNTLVNAGVGPGKGWPTGISIDAGVHANTRIWNNLILQDYDTMAYVTTNPGLSFANNLWSRIPPPNVSSSTDVIGDPQLTKSGLTGAGQLTADYFRLLSTSPAIDKGVVISEIFADFFGRTRGSKPDIGAFEYISIFNPLDFDQDYDLDLLDLQSLLTHPTLNLIFDFNRVVWSWGAY